MCDACGWRRFIADIEDMLEQRRYEWASATLKGIRDTVKRAQHATDGQAKAVANIERGRQ